MEIKSKKENSRKTYQW